MNESLDRSATTTADARATRIRSVVGGSLDRMSGARWKVGVVVFGHLKIIEPRVACPRQSTYSAMTVRALAPPAV